MPEKEVESSNVIDARALHRLNRNSNAVAAECSEEAILLACVTVSVPVLAEVLRICSDGALPPVPEEVMLIAQRVLTLHPDNIEAQVREACVLLPSEGGSEDAAPE